MRKTARKEKFIEAGKMRLRATGYQLMIGTGEQPAEMIIRGKPRGIAPIDRLKARPSKP